MTFPKPQMGTATWRPRHGATRPRCPSIKEEPCTEQHPNTPPVSAKRATPFTDGREAMPTVVFSCGMGKDSAALLARWLLEPATRPFSLDDLIVLTAMVGSE